MAVWVLAFNLLALIGGKRFNFRRYRAGPFHLSPSGFGKRQASAGSLLDRLLMRYEASQHRAGGKAHPVAIGYLLALPARYSSSVLAVGMYRVREPSPIFSMALRPRSSVIARFIVRLDNLSASAAFGR